MADIGSPHSDRAGKGRGNPLEGLKVLQPAHIRAGGLDSCGLERQVSLLLSGFLLANAGSLEQFGPAGVGDPGQREGGFGLGELGARLRQLLVKLRGVNLGEQVSRLDLRAYVH